jgi:hypothetical protein
MNRTRRTVVSVIGGFVFAFHAVLSPAQVVTGTPPFQSFGGGPDVLNLGNLNVHYSMPIFGRAGRGVPFSYALSYDSSVWKKVTSAWVPSSTTWGLNRDMAAAVGVVNGGSYLQVPGCDGQGETLFRFTGYTDSAGTLHKFLAVVDSDPACSGYSRTVVLDDGSGITVAVDGSPSASVTLKSGEHITPPLSSSPPSATGGATDSNGNEITSAVSGSTTTFYDTLNTTSAVLTIDASTASSVKYKYAGPANPAVQVVVTYNTTYTVQTNFGCSGVNEYGPVANQSLVDKITLADGSYYQFAYLDELLGSRDKLGGCSRSGAIQGANDSLWPSSVRNVQPWQATRPE